MRGTGAVRQALRAFQSEVMERWGPDASVGILTWKAVADAMMPDGSPSTLLTDNLPGLKPIVAHYGRDDVGSNRFMDCDALLLLFDPVPNVGEAEIEALTLGLDPTEYLRGIVATKLAQAEGRLRAAMGGRKGVFYFGSFVPPDWDSSAIEVQPPLLGRPASSDRDRAHQVADYLLATLGS